jgi:hypothetical protein
MAVEIGALEPRMIFPLKNDRLKNDRLKNDRLRNEEGVMLEAGEEKVSHPAANPFCLIQPNYRSYIF